MYYLFQILNLILLGCPWTLFLSHSSLLKGTFLGFLSTNSSISFLLSCYPGLLSVLQSRRAFYASTAYATAPITTTTATTSRPVIHRRISARRRWAT